MEEIIIGRDDDDLRKFGKRGTILLGKHIVGTGEDVHLTSPVKMDISRPHVILIAGKRGSGKSFSMGVLAEEMMTLPEEERKSLCGIIIDTQGIFWTMKSPNEKELSTLGEWSMKPSGFPVGVYVPEGQAKTFEDLNVEFDEAFSISPSELSSEDWLDLFEIEYSSPAGILLQMALSKLTGSYGLNEIISTVMDQRGFDNEKLGLRNMLEVARTWGIFGDSRMPKILEPGKMTVLDVSLTSQNVRRLLVTIVARKVFAERTAARRKEELGEIESSFSRKVPLCWLFIDEAHNFFPKKMPKSLDILEKIVKEGRQPGISLVLATQRPEKIYGDALSQCDLIIAHRLTAKADIESLKTIMQTYMLYDIGKYISELPRLKGSAIILDDNSERVYNAMVRPRKSWHAGSSPSVL